MILHELCHGLHWRLKEKVDTVITEAYNIAKKSGKYEQVHHFNGSLGYEIYMQKIKLLYLYLYTGTAVLIIASLTTRNTSRSARKLSGVPSEINS